MKLISACDTVAFLSQVAPRPWVDRMLHWMLYTEELVAYSASGRVQAYTSVMAFTAELYQQVGAFQGPAMDAAIREAYDPEFAAKLLGKAGHERVFDTPFQWSRECEPVAIDPGYWTYASELDWDLGLLTIDWLPDHRERNELMFPNEDMLGTEFDRAEYEAEFREIGFAPSAIEILLPTHALSVADISGSDNRRGRRSVGRPMKWSWEGAMAFVVSQAQLPDGLPTGPGAQARLEEMIAEWFINEAGDSPSVSQIRPRAASIIEAIEKPKIKNV